jgi:hypothetical protein
MKINKIQNRQKLLIILLLFSFSLFAQEYDKHNKNEQQALDKLQGLWKHENKDLFEEWVLKKGKLSATVYEINGTNKNLKEKIRIVDTLGVTFYSVIAFGQNNNEEVNFRLTGSAKDLLTFENKTHDFPTLIQYQFIGDAELVVTISGDTPKGFREIDFRLSRSELGH